MVPWLALGWFVLTFILAFLTVVVVTVFGGVVALVGGPFTVGALLLGFAMLRVPGRRVLVISVILAGILTVVGVGAFLRGSQAMPSLDAALLVIASAVLALSLRTLVRMSQDDTAL